MARFKKMRDGRYLEPESGIELIKGIDDSDGWDRIEWQVWTAQMGECIGVRSTLGEAKKLARAKLDTSQS
jgi:hypothetical protein